MILKSEVLINSEVRICAESKKACKNERCSSAEECLQRALDATKRSFKAIKSRADSIYGNTSWP